MTCLRLHPVFSGVRAPHVGAKCEVTQMRGKLADSARTPIPLERSQFLVGQGQGVTIQEVGYHVGIHEDFIQRPATRGLESGARSEPGAQTIPLL